MPESEGNLFPAMSSSIPCSWMHLYPWISMSLYQGLSPLFRFIPYSRVMLQKRLNCEMGCLSSADYKTAKTPFMGEGNYLHILGQVLWKQTNKQTSKISPPPNMLKFYILIFWNKPFSLSFQNHRFFFFFLRNMTHFFWEKEWKRRINAPQRK